MCLGIPMQIEQIQGSIARCSAKGVARDVNLMMVADQALQPGDYVMVHVGYAIQKVSEAAARSSWEAYDAMMACAEQDTPDA